MKALITGVTGQDGAYLAEYLLHEGHEVIGTYHRTDFWRLERLGIQDQIELVPAALDEPDIWRKLVEESGEIYNLAAQSHVGRSFFNPITTAQATGLGPLRILEMVRAYNPEVKFYQASTSEMFGNQGAPQNESTPFDPQSPYAASKVFAHQICEIYRKGYGLNVSCGILFNHESPLRGVEFVTRKITYHLSRTGTVVLGNPDARRDWGHARDYVRGMVLINRSGGTYVLGTGETRSVKDFAEAALEYFPRSTIKWSRKTEPRPLEVNHLRADYSKARNELGWEPEISFDELVEDMCLAELQYN